MDMKLYVERRKALGKWIVRFQGRVISQHDTQGEAQKWVEHNYPSHAYETERVQVRENFPTWGQTGRMAQIDFGLATRPSPQSWSGRPLSPRADCG